MSFMEKNQAAPERLAFDGCDPFYGESRRIHLQKTSANVRLTVFEGGHDGNYAAGFDFLLRQRKGKGANWKMPVQGSGDNRALTE